MWFFALAVVAYFLVFCFGGPYLKGRYEQRLRSTVQVVPIDSEAGFAPPQDPGNPAV